MTPKEYLRKWEGISNDDRNATFYKFSTMLRFAEDYAKEINKK